MRRLAVVVGVALSGCHGDTFIRGGVCVEDGFGYTASASVQVSLEPGDVVSATAGLDGAHDGIEQSKRWDCYHWTAVATPDEGCRRDPGQVDASAGLALDIDGDSLSAMLPPSPKLNVTIWVTTATGRDAVDSIQLDCTR